MRSILAQLLSTVRGWVGWRAAVLAIQRADGEVSTLTLPRNSPVSIRPNTDGSVGITIGHDDDGEALLADLRALMGSGDEHLVTVDTRAAGRHRQPATNPCA